MDKEQLLLEITRLEIMNRQNFEVIKGYQEVIQKNTKLLDSLRAKLDNL
jgi:hypothetical protein